MYVSPIRTGAPVLGYPPRPDVPTAGWLARIDHGNRVEDASREAALRAAADEVPQVLSYNYGTIDEDMSRAKRWTTGDFASQFADLASTAIEPAARKQKIVTSADVARAGVIRVVSASEVEVVLFVNQTTVSRQQPQPRQDGSRLQVQMKKVDGRWLIAAMQAI